MCIFRAGVRDTVIKFNKGKQQGWELCLCPARKADISVQLDFKPHSQPTNYIWTCSWIKSWGGSIKKCLVSVPVNKQMKQHLFLLLLGLLCYNVCFFFVALFTSHPAEIWGYGDATDPASSPSTFRQSSQPQTHRERLSLAGWNQ